VTLNGQTRDPDMLRAQYLEKLLELEASNLACRFVSRVPSGRTNNFPWK